MLLKILLIIVALYVLFLVSLRWLFPWLVRLYVKRSLSRMGFTHDNRRKSRRVVISTRKNRAQGGFRKRYDDADYIDFEEIKE